MKSVAFLPVVLAATGVGIASTVFETAEAASLAFSVNEFTGDNTKVDFFLQDIDGGVSILATINTTDGNVSGDISGIWFNLADDLLVGSLDIEGDDITGIQQSILGVGDLGGGVNVNGGNSQTWFDIGVKIGKNGNDDIEQTSLVVLGEGLTVDSFFAQSFAVRIKSSGANDQGSSKLKGEAPDGPPNQSRGWHECNKGDLPMPCKEDESLKDESKKENSEKGDRKKDHASKDARKKESSEKGDRKKDRAEKNNRRTDIRTKTKNRRNERFKD